MSDNILDADDLFGEADDNILNADDAFGQADENILDGDDAFGQADDAFEAASDEIGTTSQESAVSPAGRVLTDEPVKKKSFLRSFTVFDGLLLISLICVSLATLFLFYELNKFGSFPGGFPWRTSEFLSQ